MNELPKGWALTNLNNIGNWGSGGTPKRTNKDYYDGAIPWLVIGDLNDDVVIDSKNSITEQGLKNSSAKLIEKGTLLIAMYGSIGKLGIAGFQCATNQAIANCVVNNDLVSNQFLFYYLQSRREHLLSIGKGGAQQNISQTVLKAYDFPIAPINEQIRIADKLDSILAKVDKAQARLEKIPNTLKRFRQSVLAAATSGELTREWREENGVSYEWQSIKISTLVSKIEAGKNIKCDERPPHDNEFGIIKISAVTWGFYDEAQSKTLKDNKLFIENRRVGVGDFLISRANTLELLGMPVIVKKVTKNLMLSDKVLRLVMPEQEKAWLDIFLRSPKGRLEIQSRATGNQESMRNIGQKALFDIDVLLPTSIEKTEIVKIVGLLTSHVEMLEKQYFIIKSRLDKLAQSILAKAFRGELVEQNPNDEPASQLLERIKKQQLEAPKPAKKTRSIKEKPTRKVEDISSTETSEESIQLQSEVLSILQKANIELSAQQLMDKLTEQSFEQVNALFIELKRLLDAAVITKVGSGESCTFKANKK